MKSSGGQVSLGLTKLDGTPNPQERFKNAFDINLMFSIDSFREAKTISSKAEESVRSYVRTLESFGCH